jgi:flagellar biosynthesis/type III secretory pathway chaperone
VYSGEYLTLMREQAAIVKAELEFQIDRLASRVALPGETENQQQYLARLKEQYQYAAEIVADVEERTRVTERVEEIKQTLRTLRGFHAGKIQSRQASDDTGISTTEQRSGIDQRGNARAYTSE